MKEIADLIMNYGLGIICIVYFMYFNSTTLKAITDTMNEVKQSLVLLNEKIENLENRLNKRKKVKGDE